MSRGSDEALAALRRSTHVSQGLEQGPSPRLDVSVFEEISADEARREIEAVLMGPFPQAGLQRLHEEGALAALLPEVEALVGFGEGARFHKDVWEHTKQVVLQSPERARVRWAALLHDIGKVSTRRTEDGQVQFHGHAEVGARMAAKRMKRLEFDHEEAKMIRQLVLFHQRPSQYEPSWTDSAVRRFGRETAEVLVDLIDLSRADMTTKYDSKRQRGRELIDELTRRFRKLQEEDARVPPLPKGLGHAIMVRFELKPGPRIGELRRALERAVEEGQLEPHLEEAVYLEWLEKHTGSS